MSALHPTLRSLRNIPHIVRLPDPMPPVPEVLRLLQKRSFDCRIEKGILDPQKRDYQDRLFECNQNIVILENRIEELHRAFPELRAQNSPASDSLPASQIFSAENSERSERAVGNQRSSGEHKVSTSEFEVSSGEPVLTSSEFNSPGLTSTDPLKNDRAYSSETDAAPGKEASNGSSDEDEDGDEQEEPDKAEGKDEEEEEENDDESDEENDDEEEEDEDFDIADYLDDEELEAALDLRDYLSGRSPLDKLEPRVQRAIRRLLEDHKSEKVAAVIAEPPPIGFGVRTSRASLDRFGKRIDKAKEKSIKSQNAKDFQDLMAKANGPDEAFQDAIQRALKTQILQATTRPAADLGTLDALITSLNKLRKQNLAERKQRHEEEKS